MNRSLNKKGFTFAVILLFISVSVIPSTGTVTEKKFSMTFYDGDTLYVGGVGSSFIDESEDEINFEDVTVLVFGRCRGRYSDGSWIGRLFVGNIPFGGVTNNDNFLERFTVLVRNQSSGGNFFKIRLQYYDIQFLNATGVFFWGSKGSGVSNIKPIVFIRCHAEKLAISEGPWDDI